MPWIAAALVAAELAKTAFVDAPAAERQRKLAGAKEANSWLTGQHAGPVQEPNYAGNAVAGAATGLQLGQGLENQQAANKQSEATSNLLNAQASAKATEGLTAPTAPAYDSTPPLQDNTHAQMGMGEAGYLSGQGAPQGANPAGPAGPAQPQGPWLRGYTNPALKKGQYPI